MIGWEEMEKFHFDIDFFKDVTPDTNLQGFQFFINGEIQEDIPYHPSEGVTHRITFPSLDPGHYVFHWIFHQPIGSNRRKVVTVYDIEVIGSHRGGAENYESCEAGGSSHRLALFGNDSFLFRKLLIRWVRLPPLPPRDVVNLEFFLMQQM